MQLVRLLACLLLIAGQGAADPLADMAGSWRGSGWAKETLQGPQETLRCQIRNDYDAVTRTLSVSGQCVVPGRRLDISGMLIGGDDSEQITGRWSNPGGVGSAAIIGVQRDNIVAFNFSAIDPERGRKIAQNVEWRVSDRALRLRSTDRKNPDVMMSDIAFTK